MKHYTHKVTRAVNGTLCSEHASAELAKNAADRLNSMARNTHAFRAEPMAGNDPQASHLWLRASLLVMP